MRTWRLGLWLLIIAAIAPLDSATADAAKPGSFRFGVDFTFERMYATRSVADQADIGEIRLVAFVYRPVRNDRHQVVLLSHGSLGGWNLQPKESIHPNPTVLQFFIERGYTVVAPFRRGVGDSGGRIPVVRMVFLGGVPGRHHALRGSVLARFLRKLLGYRPDLPEVSWAVMRTRGD